MKAWASAGGHACRAIKARAPVGDAFGAIKARAAASCECTVVRTKYSFMLLRQSRREEEEGVPF